MVKIDAVWCILIALTTLVTGNTDFTLYLLVLSPYCENAVTCCSRKMDRSKKAHHFHIEF